MTVRDRLGQFEHRHPRLTILLGIAILAVIVAYFVFVYYEEPSEAAEPTGGAVYPEVTGGAIAPEAEVPDYECSGGFRTTLTRSEDSARFVLKGLVRSHGTPRKQPRVQFYLHAQDGRRITTSGREVHLGRPKRAGSDTTARRFRFVEAGGDLAYGLDSTLVRWRLIVRVGGSICDTVPGRIH